MGAIELYAAGYHKYSKSYLNALALTASSFNKISRRKTLSWSVHAEAGTPPRMMRAP
jgi:hypothetical protein